MIVLEELVNFDETHGGFEIVVDILENVGGGGCRKSMG